MFKRVSRDNYISKWRVTHFKRYFRLLTVLPGGVRFEPFVLALPARSPLCELVTLVGLGKDRCVFFHAIVPDLMVEGDWLTRPIRK